MQNDFPLWQAFLERMKKRWDRWLYGAHSALERVMRREDKESLVMVRGGREKQGRDKLHANSLTLKRYRTE